MTFTVAAGGNGACVALCEDSCTRKQRTSQLGSSPSWLSYNVIGLPDMLVYILTCCVRSDVERQMRAADVQAMHDRAYRQALTRLQ